MKYKWLDALETYPKTKGCLKNCEGYCCLGVLADITGNLTVDNEGVGWVGDCMASLPDPLREKLGLTPHDMKELTFLNDATDTFERATCTTKN